MTLVKLCDTDEVSEDEPLQIEIDGREPLAVYLVEGNFYVTDDTCTHGKASLADEGELDGFIIECTWHDGAFDIRTGEPTAMPCTRPIRTYPCEVQDDAVYADLAE